MERLAETRTITPATTPHAVDERAMARLLGLSLPLYAIQLILAYEWVLSGIDKVVDPNFAAQLPATVRGSTLVNPYGWYSALLKQFVLPNTALLAPAVQVGELAIGIVLIVSAVLWMWRPLSRSATYVGWLACFALSGSVLLSLNYSFQQGTPLPWVNAGQAMSPGVGIDMLVAFLSMALLAANLWALRIASVRLRSH